MQGTTLALGRLLSRLPENRKGAGLQDAITPKAQNLMNTIMIILGLCVFVLGVYIYNWYITI
jgi:hypothetical protein